MRRKPNAILRFYRCAPRAAPVPALDAEQMVRDALDHAPESRLAEDKLTLTTYSAAFNLMWPVN